MVNLITRDKNSPHCGYNKRRTYSFEGIKYKLTLTSDGEHDKDFSTQYSLVDKSSTVDVKLLRHGGFVARLRPVE